MNNFQYEPSIIARWLFASGALGVDSVGANTLTVVNAPASVAGPRAEIAGVDMEYDSGQYFEIADANCDGLPLLPGSSPTTFSILFPFRFESYAALRYIIGRYKFDTNQRSFLASVNTSRQLQVTVGTDGLAKVDFAHASTLSTNTWYLACVSYQYVGVGNQNVVRIRILSSSLAQVGTDLISTTAPVIYIPPAGSGSIWRIGANGNVTVGGFYDGVLAEMVFASRIFTTTESDAILAGTFGQGVPEPVDLDSSFECGNGIKAATFESPTGTYNVICECDPSPAPTSWCDWFYFRLSNVNGLAPIIRVDFNGDRTGGPYWTGTHSAIRPVWSHDQVTWNRLSSINSYSGDILQFTLPTMAQNTVYVAMDIPALYSGLVSDIATWDSSPYCSAQALSYSGITGSQGGRNIYYLRIEDSGSSYTNKFQTIITARTHPGEPQAGWHMRGMIDWILGSDPVAVALRERSILHIFPCVNPDGVVGGRLRSFNSGLDGNRGYDVTGPNSSTEPPEVFLIHSKIAEIQAGVAFAIDLHSNNYDSPRIVYDATNDTWLPADLAAIVSALNSRDASNYYYDAAYNMVLDYVNGFRGGLRYQFGIDVAGIEGGIYDDESGAYPTAAQREAAGAVFLRAWIETFEEAIAGSTVQFTASIACTAVTPDAALTVDRGLFAAVSAGTITPDAALQIERALSALAAVTSSTPDAALLIGSIALIASINAVAVTPDATLSVNRGLAAAVSAGMITPDAVLQIERALSALAAVTSSTPDTALLIGSIALIASINAVAGTPDATLSVNRGLSAAVSAGTITPDAALQIERALSALAAVTSSTPDAALLIGSITLLASINAVAGTLDAALTVDRGLSAAVPVGAVTSDVTLQIERLLSTLITVACSTPDAALLVAKLGQIIDATLYSMSIRRGMVSKTTQRTVVPI
jgi:hypothetical protein